MIPGFWVAGEARFNKYLDPGFAVFRKDPELSDGRGQAAATGTRLEVMDAIWLRGKTDLRERLGATQANLGSQHLVVT